MERGSTAFPLSLLVVPVAGILVASALTLGAHPFLGATLHRDVAVGVERGGPAERAGIRVGDRLIAHGGNPLDAVVGPAVGARIGRPYTFERERDGTRTPVVVTPVPLPAEEHRMMAAQLAVACGFMFLGGWVWSERRDRLTRPFVALTYVFAVVLAPQPVLPASGMVAHAIAYALATLLLPALSIHVFALFPEPPAARRPSVAVAPAYGVATLLAAATLATLVTRVAAGDAARPLESLLEVVASLWFVAGLVAALALFVRSYLAAGSLDARRRLRVALAGTVFGLAPILVVIALRTLSPGTPVPGERIAVFTTLLVPAAFAWAIAVHRIFEFRLALRALLMTAVLVATAALAGIATHLAASALGHPTGADPVGIALAILAAAAALAGPAHPVGAAVGRWLVPERGARELDTGLETWVRDAAASEVLARACAAIAGTYKLDGCAAIERDGAAWAGTIVTAGGGMRPAPELAPVAAAALGRHGLPVALEESGFDAATRDALESAGAQWLLPVGEEPHAVLLLGHRLAGPWLDRHEQRELARFAHALSVELENVSLRRAARDHGVLDRELAQAGALQTRLLPRRAPIYPTLDCAAATLSAQSVGGDYYDFVERGDRAFTLVVGDAMGHGVPAALLLAGVQARFRSVARSGEMPGAVLAEINHELVSLEQPEKFVGLLCAWVDVRMGRLHLANAGLTPPLVRRRNGVCELVTEGGLVLGVSDEAEYRDVCVPLTAGDLAILYTDGLTEARRGDEMFGIDRVRAVLDAHAHRRARDVLAALLAAVREWAEPPLDDLTVLVLKQLADPQPVETRIASPTPARPARPAAMTVLKPRTAGADTTR
ncbi:MAG TPA: SpoIIE family protein phosphatase [Dongiaceae bacterium]|nr:SpoIIE family protein phosphatase [Dongiaceae bacterium]